MCTELKTEAGSTTASITAFQCSHFFFNCHNFIRIWFSSKFQPKLMLSLKNHPNLWKCPDIKSGHLFQINLICFSLFAGLKTTINDHNMEEFWRHQLTATSRPCVVTLNAMMLRHPEKNCSVCQGGLYGRFCACSSCDHHLCTSCVENIANRCPTHGVEFIDVQLVPIPADILQHKHREYSHEKLQHQRYLERQRVGTLASNVFRVVRNQ